MPNYREPYIDWKQWISKLGTMPDESLAKQIGCSRSTVIYTRNLHGVPPAKSRSSQRGWSEAEIKLLGTDTDAAIAKHLKMSILSVSRKRRALGISPAYPEADNRSAAHNFSGDPEIVAAVRRAMKSGLEEDEIVYIFGNLIERKTTQ
jgi:hypothetical protein